MLSLDLILSLGRCDSASGTQIIGKKLYKGNIYDYEKSIIRYLL